MLRMPQVDEPKAAKPSYVMAHGSRRDRIKMLGNGVCPPVMKAVVERLARDCD